ncbi:MAG: hypothetical protein H0V82_11430 [Candidatus Protochlamydia sp.]|nr:hypothetical protein [Candidatus Protochlamydia sp.]
MKRVIGIDDMRKRMAKSFLLDFSHDQNEYTQKEIDQISNEAKHESRPAKSARKAKRK